MSVAADWISLRHCYVELRFCSFVAFFSAFLPLSEKKKALRVSCTGFSVACPFEGLLLWSLPQHLCILMRANCELHVWMGSIIASGQEMSLSFCARRDDYVCFGLISGGKISFCLALLFGEVSHFNISGAEKHDSDYICRLGLDLNTRTTAEP